MGDSPKPTGPEPVRVWDFLYKAALLATVALVATVINLQVRQSTTESNRFTDRDGSEMENRLKTWVEERYPPEWLKLDIYEIKSQTALIPAIKVSLEELDARVRRLEDGK